MALQLLLISPSEDALPAVLDRLATGCRAGLRFRHVTSAEAAIRTLHAQPYEALLLDVGTSPADSAPCLRRLCDEADGIPVIVLTDTEDEEVGARAVSAGAQDYLVKSRINGDILRRVVRYSQERLRAQRELASLSRQRRMILETIAEGVLGTDERGRVSYVNSRGQALLGRSAAELVGLAVRDALGCAHGAGGCEECFRHHPADQQRVTFVSEGGTPLEIQCSAVGQGGAGVVVVFRDLSERLRHERELEGLVEERTRALTQEIADRKAMEAALRVSQHRTQAITDSLFESVLVLEADGRIAFSNRSAENLLGSGAALAGLHVDEVLTVAQGGVTPLPFAAGPLRGVAETGGVLRDDDAVFLAGGRRLMVAYAASPLIDGGRRSGVIISFRDIGDIKKAQQEALQASKLASVGQLAAGVAHEINTPIQYIGDNLRFIGDSLASLSALISRTITEAADEEIARLAQEADLDFALSEMPEAVAQSLQGVDHISRIVLAMRAFSHPSDSDRSAMDLNEAVQTVLTVSRNEWKHSAQLRLDLQPDLPPVLAAPGEINQVLLNLIVNAAHAMEEAGRKDKGLLTVATRQRGGWAEVTVADNGTGMAEAVKQRIFDPFFTTKDVGKGTGQGLAICHDIVVNKHGGRITVDSEEGRGSCFTIALPLPDGEAEEA